MAKILIPFIFFLSFIYANEDTEDTNFKVNSFSKTKLKNTILQTYEESCGASALATLINLYGYSFDEKDILEKAPNTNLLSFSNLSEIANQLNFDSSGYKINIETFNKLTIPVIAKIDNRENYSHFVVVKNHYGDFVSIFDPSFGYYVETKKEFFKWWNNDNYGLIFIIIPKDISHKLKNIDLILPNQNFLSKK